MSSRIQAVLDENAAAANLIRRIPFKVRSAHFVARCVQNVWLLLAATPVIVVICAIKG
ncbi:MULTISPECIES: hypothetical protein [Asaia]|uniref:Uncharacterized protein n=2 Tax=Asaia bogorensis TaxID=91915 RepID=A0AAN4R1C4_9PROT|nr:MULTISPECIES: hypothetical protein [Asaia]ETC99652.1 hypothetical protein P792_03050 [Asaia sp. SF2.1]MDL2170215.1 hypothetical protein [Asaia sp. HumB]MDR6182633.1 hypothetical protein [Asaia bogorensis NBRC 16594]CDG38461.1 hypothetical protein ASAP_0416 [Asaia bogorensis]BAT20227.1 hypothetical protein Asbog_01969 [Asaia bogorensis NBRC 16594]